MIIPLINSLEIDFKGLSILATKLFIWINFHSSPTFYKCGWFAPTKQILSVVDKSSNAPPTKFAQGKNLAKSTK